MDSDGDGILDHNEVGLTLGDADRDRVDNMFDADFTKGQDDNGDGIDDSVVLSDANNNGIVDFLDSKVRVARTTLMHPVVKPEIEKKLAKLATKPVQENAPKPVFKAVIKSQENQTASPKKIPQTEPKQVVVTDVASKLSPVTKQKSSGAIQITGDADGDGLSNAVELALGMNPTSNDSDSDGVPDFIEIGSNNKKPQDSDQDGTPDVLDDDDDNDGILTKLEDIDRNGQAINDDTDKDGVPNYLDANDDGDSRLTKLEGAEKDSDRDGVPDYLDNSDGVSTAENAKVVVLYDEKNKSNQSVKEKTTGFNIVTKAE
ncbi:hypothetical protein [Leucothrix arctica]|uniref:EF-hand domain-containing protein n=1 Tax=Leucothrix arctica TaxID=1481894 RepID=A0A317CQF8_9GAMM|nr:hypothetical protein [Leucothrix arctica]PWQ98532.1 hypothetical protein DKT75_03520 [Leucothrix arctica]